MISAPGHIILSQILSRPWHGGATRSWGGAVVGILESGKVSQIFGEGEALVRFMGKCSELPLPHSHTIQPLCPAPESAQTSTVLPRQVTPPRD